MGLPLRISSSKLQKPYSGCPWQQITQGQTVESRRSLTVQQQSRRKVEARHLNPFRNPFMNCKLHTFTAFNFKEVPFDAVSNSTLVQTSHKDLLIEKP